MPQNFCVNKKTLLYGVVLPGLKKCLYIARCGENVASVYLVKKIMDSPSGTASFGVSPSRADTCAWQFMGLYYFITLHLGSE